ncbi:pseudouridine synthase [Trichophaea hybrida]|nr:pseudouridine synthase [Trichophaea hybrida]
MTPPLEGLLAINKPTGLSSAEALRRLQKIFKPSAIFADTLQAEKEKRERESHNQRVRRRNPNAVRNEVKIGHGGTLDPMASGVLIAGIGGGTKYLQQFLNCTKTYEATAMFGASTDTYDAVGKVVKWAEWEGIDREKVENALEQFKGDIMQVPPIYSALHMSGKRLYEYAREGIPLPATIQARPVSTVSLELTDFTYDHAYEFPKEEVPEEEKIALSSLVTSAIISSSNDVGEKRARDLPTAVEEEENVAKKQKSASDSEIMPDPEIKPDPNTITDVSSTGAPNATAATETAPPTGRLEEKPFIVTLRMTVTSGFYVRSLIHDLGQALGSAAHMVKLVRTRQSDYEVGKENVMEWEDLMEKPEEFWGPKVEGLLRKWAEENPKAK